jgi:hypothetical protein
MSSAIVSSSSRDPFARIDAETPMAGAPRTKVQSAAAPRQMSLSSSSSSVFNNDTCP